MDQHWTLLADLLCWGQQLLRCRFGWFLLDAENRTQERSLILQSKRSLSMRDMFGNRSKNFTGSILLQLLACLRSNVRTKWHFGFRMHKYKKILVIRHSPVHNTVVEENARTVLVFAFVLFIERRWWWRRHTCYNRFSCSKHGGGRQILCLWHNEI